jgi:PAS domain S-box-containing protein
MFQHDSDKGRDPVNDFIDETGVRSLMEKVFEGDSIPVEEAVYRPGDGSGTRIFKVNGIPVLRNEKVVEALLIIEDVTNWKMLEEDLIRSEERYRNIFNHAHCGIFFVDKDGNYLDANPTALDMLGYTRDELLTLNTREISSDSDQRIGKLKSSPGWVVEETRYLRKDGKIVEAELAGTSFRSGDETYFIGIVKDLTRRKQLERQLSAILGETETALLIFDPDGRITNASSGAAALLESGVDEITGQKLVDLAPDCNLNPVEMAFDSPAVVTLGGPDGIRVQLKRLPVDPEAGDPVVLLVPVISNQ